jgi:hypothetical protein
MMNLFGTAFDEKQMQIIAYMIEMITGKEIKHLTEIAEMLMQSEPEVINRLAALVINLKGTEEQKKAMLEVVETERKDEDN